MEASLKGLVKVDSLSQSSLVEGRLEGSVGRRVAIVKGMWDDWRRVARRMEVLPVLPVMRMVMLATKSDGENFRALNILLECLQDAICGDGGGGG